MNLHCSMKKEEYNDFIVFLICVLQKISKPFGGQKGVKHIRKTKESILYAGYC